MSEQGIEVGDWVVAGGCREDREIGQIVELYDGPGLGARVRWAHSGTTDWDLSADDVEVYAHRLDAERRERELDEAEELPS